MTDRELDGMMKSVLMDAIALEAQDLPESAAAFSATRHFSKEMNRMLNNPLRWARQRERTPWQNAAHWAAMVFLTISIGFGMLMLFSAPARAAVERWVVEWYQTHIVYRHFGSEENLPSYGFTGLPAGFAELDRQEGLASASVLYGNEEGELICLDYERMQQGVATVFTSNDDTITEVQVCGNFGMLFLPQDPNSLKTLTWTDDSAGIQFTIIADLDEAELLCLAESLYQKK